MRKKRIAIALIALALILNTNYARCENTLPDENETVQTSPAIDVEQFKQELQKVSAVSPVINTLNGRVKTLNTKYLLSPGDVLSLSVYGEPEFTQPSILVRPDGFATIEPFGEINVAGLDINQLTYDLKNRFKEYLLNPKISVKINSMQAAKVYIYGAVQKPGLYQQEKIYTQEETGGRSNSVYPELTVASVIANAGGIKYNADLRHVKIINSTTSRNEEIDLMRLIENGDSSQDIYLRSGDSIYIPILASGAQISDKDFMLISSSSIAPADFPVRVVGAVTKPGICKLTSASPTLNSAIAASEGYTLDADKKVVIIQRITSQGNISTLQVNPTRNDLVLRPNDIVIVNDKSSSVAQRGFGFLANVINPFGRFADSYNSWAEMFDPTRRYRRW